MERFEQATQLSAEQQEQLDGFLEAVRPIVEALVDSNEESCADKIGEITQEFRRNHPDISGDDVRAGIKKITEEIEDMKRATAA